MNIILMGMPGSGKGTQSKFLIENYGLKHISTGDIIREEIKKDTELGKRADAVIQGGNLLDDKTVIEIVESFIKKSETDTGFLFDGFPRTLKQSNELLKLFGKNSMKLDLVILLNIKEETVIKRVKERGQRLGETENSLQETLNRIDIFKNETFPIIKILNHGYKLIEINGELSAEEISNQLKEIVENLKCLPIKK